MKLLLLLLGLGAAAAALSSGCESGMERLAGTSFVALFEAANAECVGSALNDTRSDECAAGVASFQSSCEGSDGFLCAQGNVVMATEGGSALATVTTGVCVSIECGSSDLQQLVQEDPPCPAGFYCGYRMQCYPPLSLQDGLLVLVAVIVVLGLCVACGRGCSAASTREAERDRVRGRADRDFRQQGRRSRGAQRQQRRRPPPGQNDGGGFFARLARRPSLPSDDDDDDVVVVPQVPRAEDGGFERWLEMLVRSRGGGGAGPTAEVSDVSVAIGELPLTEAGEAHEGLECAICLEPLLRGAAVRDLACSHSFHQRCIDEWLVISAACPLCKRDPLAAL